MVVSRLIQERINWKETREDGELSFEFGELGVSMGNKSKGFKKVVEYISPGLRRKIWVCRFENHYF